MCLVGIVGTGAWDCGCLLQRLWGQQQGRVLFNAEAAGAASELSALVVLSLTGQAWEKGLASALPEGAALVLNTDRVRQYPYPLRPGLRLITCGLDRRASVTASSLWVEEGRQMVQCCVQRGLPGRNGWLEPQEFSITAPVDNDDVSAVLAAAVTARLC